MSEVGPLSNHFHVNEKVVAEMFGEIPPDTFLEFFETQVNKETILEITEQVLEDEEIVVNQFELTLKVIHELILIYGGTDAFFDKKGFKKSIVKKVFKSDWLKKEIRETFFDNITACELFVLFFMEVLATPEEFRTIYDQVWTELNDGIIENLMPRVPYFETQNIEDFFDIFAGYLEFSHLSALKIACTMYGIKVESLIELKKRDYSKFCAIHKYAGEIYTATPSAVGSIVGVQGQWNLFKYNFNVQQKERVSRRGICPFAPYVKNYFIGMGQFLRQNKQMILSTITEASESTYNIEA